MLLNATPRLSLRRADHRSVCNRVGTDRLLLSAQDAKAITDRLLCGCSVNGAGDAMNHRTVYALESLAGALKRVAQQVMEAVNGMGIVVTQDDMEESLLLVARGVTPHYDANRDNLDRWRDEMFWTVCLIDTDTDVVFGNLGLRVPQVFGVLTVFDPCQPHSLMAREHPIFMESHFDQRRLQCFAAGSFKISDWSALGVNVDLHESKMESQTDILAMRVDKETCQMIEANKKRCRY